MSNQVLAQGTGVQLPEQQVWMPIVPIDDRLDHRQSVPAHNAPQYQCASDLAYEYMHETGLLGKTPFDSEASHLRRVCREQSSAYGSRRVESSWYTLGCREVESIAASYQRELGSLTGGPFREVSRPIRCSADVLGVFSPEGIEGT